MTQGLKKRHVCPDCCELGLRTFPVKPTTRAIAAGVIRFFAILKEDREPDQRCDQCGQVKQVFTYPMLDTLDDPECVHCLYPPNHPIHKEAPPDGHRFQPKETKAS